MSKNTARILLPTAFFMFVLGFIITFATSQVLSALYYVLVCFFIIVGIVQLFSFFWNKEHQEKMYLNLFMGVTSIWFALFTFKNFDLFITLLPAIVSVYSLMTGIGLIIKYYESKVKDKWTLIGMIVSFVLAFLLVTRPILMGTLYVKMAGLYLVGLSVYYLIKSILRLTDKE